MISKLGKNEPVNMDSMLKICDVLEYDIGNIVEKIDDNTQNKGGRK